MGNLLTGSVEIGSREYLDANPNSLVKMDNYYASIKLRDGNTITIVVENALKSGVVLGSEKKYLKPDTLLRLRELYKLDILDSRIQIESCDIDWLTLKFDSDTYKLPSVALRTTCRFPMSGVPHELANEMLTPKVKFSLLNTFRQDIMQSIKISKANPKDPYVEMIIWCDSFTIDPYKLLINNFSLPWKDVQQKSLDLYAQQKLGKDQVDEIESKWETSIEEMSKYFQMKHTKYMKMLKVQGHYISKLHKSETDALVRYIRGSMMGLKYAESRVCFETDSYNSNDLANPVISFSSGSKIESHFNKKFSIQNINKLNIADVKTIISVLKHAPQPVRRLLLFRGVQNIYFNTAKVDDILYHPNIMSTSAMLVTSLGFVGGPCCLLELEVDTDEVHALFVYNYFSRSVPMANEFEVVLPPVVMKVQSINTIDMNKKLTKLELRMMRLQDGSVDNERLIKVIRVKVMKPKNIHFDQNCISLS